MHRYTISRYTRAREDRFQDAGGGVFSRYHILMMTRRMLNFILFIFRSYSML